MQTKEIDEGDQTDYFPNEDTHHNASDDNYKTRCKSGLVERNINPTALKYTELKNLPKIRVLPWPSLTLIERWSRCA